jgi:hypothetical protein
MGGWASCAGKSAAAAVIAACSALHRAVEAERQGDLGVAVGAGRRDLGQARNLPELLLQRVGHGEGVGLRVRAVELGGDEDVRDVHPGQRRDGQEQVGGDADQDDAGHQHEGGDRAADEEARKPAPVVRPVVVRSAVRFRRLAAGGSPGRVRAHVLPRLVVHG